MTTDNIVAFAGDMASKKPVTVREVNIRLEVIERHMSRSRPPCRNKRV